MSVQFAALILTASPPGVAAGSSGAMVKIDGRESLVRSADLFLNRENIPQVIAVFQADSVEAAKSKFGAHFSFAGVRVAAGGPKWLDQIAAGLAKLPAEITHVIIHDASRPAVSYAELEAIMDAASAHDSIALTTATHSQLIELDEAKQGVGYRDGSDFAQLLTPQVYARKRLERAVQDKSMPHASELHLVQSTPTNLRVDGAADASLVKAMIGLLPKPKIKAANNPFEEAQW